MAIITVLSGSYCHGDEIVSALSKQLGHRQLDDLLFTDAAEKYGVSRDKLESLLCGVDPFRDKRSKDRFKMLARLEVTLAELIQTDDVMLGGCAGFMIPNSIAHVLRVCVIADVKYRVAEASKSDGLSEPDALENIQAYDRQIGECILDLVAKQAYDERLYDIVVPMDRTSPEEAVRLIVNHAQSDAIKTTDWSRRTAHDFLLSARVKLALAESGHLVEVFSDNGHVTVGINEQALMMGRLHEKVKSIARSVSGVSEVTTKLGSRLDTPSVNPWEGIDAPPKILLVDDEREFVQTLSERLKTRNLESSIAYDGEQALEMVKEDAPDVIVLDIMMPGIDGIETLRRVKQTNPEVEVIVLTGHGSDREQTVAEELGVFAYLRKPINVNQLAGVMKEAYARRQSNR